MTLTQSTAIVQHGMVSRMNFRRGGSWGIWHIVRDTDSLPVCGNRSRLQNDIVTAPESVEQRVLNGQQTGVCGSCMRITANKAKAVQP